MKIPRKELATKLPEYIGAKSVVLSYDITYAGFRTEFLSYMEEVYGLEQISESLYSIKEQKSSIQLKEMIKLIKIKYDTYKRSINETIAMNKLCGTCLSKRNLTTKKF